MAAGKAKLSVEPGHVFLGKYRVDAILGSGGMGIVAQCTHLALGEKVAIKMLREDVLRDEDAVERFTREAQAAAKLKSEHVAHVSDVGRFENGVPYMVMEYLEGLDLDQLVEQRGVLPVPWVVELMLQTASALAEAHSIGIVHRDIKPSNLFVTWRPDGSPLVKVLDFGISKSPMGTDMQLTQTQSLLGTPAYMSPEQMRSARTVDARTDIWSLGTVMYEILEGRKPFEAESFSEMCVKVAVDPPANLTNTPLGLQAVILRCLAKIPEQRYPSMAELARDLIPFAQDQHSAALNVERIFRMLRRSLGDGGWEGMTTSSGARVQAYRGNEASAPAHSPWAGGTPPSVAAYPGTGPIAQPPQPGYLMPDSTLQTTSKRRGWVPWVALVGVAAVIGITIGVVASSGGGDEPRAPTATPGIVDKKAVDPGTADGKPADSPGTAAALTAPPDKTAADAAKTGTDVADAAKLDAATLDAAKPGTDVASKLAADAAKLDAAKADPKADAKTQVIAKTSPTPSKTAKPQPKSKTQTAKAQTKTQAKPELKTDPPKVVDPPKVDVKKPVGDPFNDRKGTK